uniref:FAM69 protein-kinase domain-containing protein n=1 Tax=Branchiostoma floridae TaxID=7739 RepID=C3ZED3_BRAFL|eukprot:XP_002593078.1 hypothetical protein BRAFLDRAFT_72848 [Branchiostoma floridae]
MRLVRLRQFRRFFSGWRVRRMCGFFFFVVFFYCFVFQPFSYNQLTDTTFLGEDKCPACFGTDLCEEFENGKILFKYSSRLRILDIFNIKNVYFAIYEGMEVALKRLGHNSEFDQLDRWICETGKEGPQCHIPSVTYYSNFSRVIYEGLSPKSLGDMSDMVRCPSQRLIDRVLEKFAEHLGKETEELSYQEKLHFLSTLKFNPEPLMLQTFPITEGWPFPFYFGACGRLTVVQKCDKTLASYYSAPWLKRVELSLQMMKIAEYLTNNEADFGLYLTDISYENFGVTSDGNLFVIDVENVIVVDKQKIKADKPRNWEARYQSHFDECPGMSNCLSFDVSALCRYLHTDHNYYAVCRNMLSEYASEMGKPGGLLHDPPETVVRDGTLQRLLAECAKPRTLYGRFDAAKELIELLGSFLKDR